MQPLLAHLDAIDAALKSADTTDLTALADMHSRFESVLALAEQTRGLSSGQVEQLAARSNDARRKLEELILNEANDATAHIQAVQSAAREIAEMLQAASSVHGPAVTLAEPVDHFEAAQQAAAESPADEHEAFPQAAHVFNSDDLPLVAEFVAEAGSHLETAETELLRLEEDPGNLEAIGALFRAFHTIKGVSGFLNLNQIQSLAHAAENLLDLGREGKLRITGAASDLVLQSIDLMKRLISAVDEAAKANQPLQPMPGVKDLATNLNQLADRVLKGEHVEDIATPTGPATQTIESNESAEPAKPKASASDNTVKVATDRLDSLINMVGELVIANSMVTQDVASHLAHNQRLSRHIGHLGKIVRDLQDLSMSLRMVPVNAVFRKMTRLVRDVARKAGKEVELVITGAETELDRNVVEALNDPLMHMVRNSIDHGIEPPDQREAAGKPRVGRLELKAYHKGGSINIEIVDDGRGLNKDRIRAKAVAAGLVREDEELSDAEIYKLIFAPGLSTADKVTDISGRGVGMDVVKRNIEALRGRIEITTEKGKGSVFTIRLPLTLAVIDGLVVKVGQNKYILPITSIEQSMRPMPDQLSTVQGRGEIVNVRGAILPLVRLHRLFNIEPRTSDPTEALVVIVQDNDRRVCLLVDELLGQEQVVIKSLGEDIGETRGISGGAVLGDGNVSLILDVPGLIELTH